MKYGILLAISLLLFSCKKNEEEIANDYDYYPLEVGRWYVYDVELTKYNGSPDGKDSSYQVKEEIVSPITVEDETRYQVYRYYRANSNVNWEDQPDSVWTVFLRGNQLVKVEDNVRFVKLSFPIEPAKTWNGNSMNTRDAEDYEFADVKRGFKIPNGGDYFTPTATVIQSNSLDFYNKDYRKEVYAENIGLVYRISEIYKYQQSQPGDYIINVGTKIQYKLVDHGKN